MSYDQRRVEELLSGLLDDELSADERREALALIKRDPEVRELFEHMRASAEAMRAEDAPAPPADLAGRIGERVRKSGGQVIEPPRRRWLGPAALTAAASVAAALLIGALLHDHWEVFAPKLRYEEASTAEPSAPEPTTPEPSASESAASESAASESAVPEPLLARPSVEKAELERQKDEAPPAEARERGVALDSVEADAPAPKASRPLTPEAQARRDEELKKKIQDLDVPEVVEETVTVTLNEAAGGGGERVADRRSEQVYGESYRLAPAAPGDARQAAPLSCSTPWTSSTLVQRAENAPDNANELLSALVRSLGGRLEREPEASLLLPAKSVSRFIEALPQTGHVFLGPTPVLPKDRDCLRLRLK